jgi:hypothetical protein
MVLLLVLVMVLLVSTRNRDGGRRLLRCSFRGALFVMVFLCSLRGAL